MNKKTPKNQQKQSGMIMNAKRERTYKSSKQKIQYIENN